MFCSFIFPYKAYTVNRYYSSSFFFWVWMDFKICYFCCKNDWYYFFLNSISWSCFSSSSIRALFSWHFYSLIELICFSRFHPSSSCSLIFMVFKFFSRSYLSLLSHLSSWLSSNESEFKILLDILTALCDSSLTCFCSDSIFLFF